MTGEGGGGGGRGGEAHGSRGRIKGHGERRVRDESVH